MNHNDFLIGKGNWDRQQKHKKISHPDLIDQNSNLYW